VRGSIAEGSIPGRSVNLLLPLALGLIRRGPPRSFAQTTAVVVGLWSHVEKELLLDPCPGLSWKASFYLDEGDMSDAGLIYYSLRAPCARCSLTRPALHHADDH
jgi:hypothetical protein